MCCRLNRDTERERENERERERTREIKNERERERERERTSIDPFDLVATRPFAGGWGCHSLRGQSITIIHNMALNLNLGCVLLPAPDTCGARGKQSSDPE